MNTLELLRHAKMQSADSKWDYFIASEVLYPGMIAKIRDVLNDGPELARAKLRAEGLADTPILRQYLPRAERIPADIWNLALEEPHTHQTQETLDLRKEVLEVARLWFTELLHKAHNYNPLSLRILKAPDNIFRWKP